MTERAAAARHPALGAPATRAGTGLAVGEIPRRPESPAGLATSKHVPDSHHPTPSLSSLSCSQVASTALCSPRRHEYKPKHGNKGRTGNRPGLCLDTVLSAHLRSGNIRMDPVGAGPPWEHSCPALTHRIHTHRPVRRHTCQLRSPRPPQINGSRQGPTPPHTCIRMPSLRPPRARPEPSGANLKTHSDLASRTPTGPGASAGRRKMRTEEAGTQQLPTRHLPQNIRPTQLPGREWI